MAARAAGRKSSGKQQCVAKSKGKAETLREHKVASKPGPVTMGQLIASGMKPNIFSGVPKRTVKNHFDDGNLSRGKQIEKAAAWKSLGYRQQQLNVAAIGLSR